MLSATAITAYTATILVHAETEKYNLDQPVAWSLNDGIQTGQTSIVRVFLEGLEPNSEYTFSVGRNSFQFKTMQCFGLVSASDYGLRADAEDNSKAFSNAIVAVPNGGTLVVPAGMYKTSPIFLKSDMTLYLPEGAEIVALGNRDKWPIVPAYDKSVPNCVGTWEGLPAASFASPITAINCQNLNLTGRGTINGGGEQGDWWDWPKETRQGARRPRTVFAAKCDSLKISGLTIRNSPSWTIHLFNCKNVLAAALHIENPAKSPNTDGLNPESCTDVEIKGCRISVGDDCIAIKSGKRGTGSDTRRDHVAPTRFLSISNCLMEDGHGAVVMGSEMSGDITDVTIQRCEFKGTDRGLRIKTRRGRGGKVARISLKDVCMDQVNTGVAVNAFYYCDADGKSDFVQSRRPRTVDETTPNITDITIDRVTMTGVKHAVGAFLGLPEAPLNGMHLSNIKVSYHPSASPGDTLMACHLPQSKHGGILQKFAHVSTDDALRPIVQEFADVS